MTLHCERALIEGVAVRDVRLLLDAEGTIRAIEQGVPAESGDLRLGVVLPGAANAHSHAFHRVLRGRTHDGGGDFWLWRERMYRAAASLDPARYRRLATAVFAEMLTAGWTSVAEFHYLHHRPDGTAYPDRNAMGLALVDAAEDVGIRLTLLDTCYLSSGPGTPLLPEQRGFGDGDVRGWAHRWSDLRAAVGSRAVVGAAVHSLRAMSPAQVAEMLEVLPPETPLHVHLSEQPAENEAVSRAYGASPTAVLRSVGALSERLSVVHATHLSPADIEMLGAAHVTAVFCPTTEADLGDGIGPARALVDAGARLALGSDQNAVVDPWLEVRGLESGERLASRARGRFSLPELERVRAEDGARSLGRRGGIRVGAPADLVELDAASVRTVGSKTAQLPLTATAADVRRVVVGGTVVADAGVLASGRAPAALLAGAFGQIDRAVPREGQGNDE